MNARHPIDELFAHGLRDAEATPPSGVWQRIAHDRDERAAAARRRRSRAGLLLLLLIGGIAATYLLTRDPGRNALTQATPPTAPRSVAHLVTSTSAPNQAARSAYSAAAPQDAATRGNAIPDPSAEAPSTVSSGTEASERAPMRKPAATTHRDTKHNSPARAAQSDAVIATETQRSAVPLPLALRQEEQRPFADGSAPMRFEENGHMDGRSDRMATIPVALLIPPVAPVAPRGADRVPYVLPKGTSWYGLQLELTATNYHWTGPAGESTALNNSETWGGRKGLGVVYGRDWQSGFGVEVSGTWSRVRSNLFYAEQGPAVMHNTTDTTWTGTSLGQHTIYTWNIVTTSVAEPGPTRTYSAVNAYSVLRFDALASYQRSLGRWTAVLRAGPTLTLFPAREGNTLVAAGTATETSAGSMIVVPLNSASLDDRFAPSVGLLAGVDLRYGLSEHIMLGLGPTFLTTLGGEQMDNVRMNGSEWGGTLRLIYKPTPHERKGK